MLSHVKYGNFNFTWIEKIEILSRHPNVKNKIALNIICQKKIYNALFFSVFQYIHQLHMLSHLKHRNFIFKLIDKNLNIIQAHQW